MTPTHKTLLVAALSCGLTACSAGGIFNAERQTPGPIYVVDPTTGDRLASGTSPTNPFLASAGGFSIGLLDENYDGPYTISQTGFSTPNTQFNFSCFDPHDQNNGQKIDIVRFQIDGGVPIAGSGGADASPQPTPCEAGEREAYSIQDTKGHTTTFYLEIP